MKSICIMVIILLSLLIPIFVDGTELFLTDGTRLEGQITAQTDELVTIQTDMMTITVPRSRIKTESKIEKDVKSEKGKYKTAESSEDALLQKADELFKTGKFQESAQIYKKVLEINPLNPTAHTRLQIIDDFLKMSDKGKSETAKQEVGKDLPTRKPPTELNTITKPSTKNELDLPQIKEEKKIVEDKKGDVMPPPLTRQQISQTTSQSAPQGIEKTQVESQTYSKPPLIDTSQASSPPSPPSISQSDIPISTLPQLSQPVSPPALGKPPLMPFPESKETAQIQQTPTQLQKPSENKDDLLPKQVSKPSLGFDSSTSERSDTQQIQKPSLPATDIQPSSLSPPLGSIVLASSKQPLPSLSGVNEVPVKADINAITSNLPPPSTGTSTKVEPPFISEPNLIAQDVSKSSAPTPSASQPQTSNNQDMLKIPSNYDINSPEFRAVYITRYEWPDTNPDVVKQKITNFFENLNKHNFNAVVFQIRSQGDVLYKSPIEPWSAFIGGADPGFDPLEFAIEEAHKNNIEFHAYINAMTIWQGNAPPPHSNPEHPYWLYCAPENPKSWVCVDDKGIPMSPQKSDDGYVWISPGIPEVQAYIRNVAVDMVKRYKVDGIHFDRIRYPQKWFSYDQISDERFKGDGNPDNLSLNDWRRDQITKILNDIYGAINAVNPKIKMTCSAWGVADNTRIKDYTRYSSGYHDYYQDAYGWIKKGIMDALIPMIYWDSQPAIAKKPCYFEVVEDYKKNIGERHLYPAQAIYRTDYDFKNLDEYVKETNYTRFIGGKGNVGFSITGYDQKNLWDHITQKVYPNKVPVPEMPWKTNPTTGFIIGYVKDANGKSVVDAKINLSDRAENWLSCADGFFAMLYVNPGDKYKITATKNNIGTAVVENISVSAGKPTNVEVILK